MHTNLTLQQQAAVLERGVSVGLSAGAGSGKTHVLTQRYLSHLDPAGPDAKHPVRLDELLAITFTDAAAREMRERVRAACFIRLDQAPLEEQRHWYELLRSLDSARISTIHAFCGRFLRQHAVEAGIDPRFSVLEENQAEILRIQVVDDLLRENLTAEDEPTMHLAHAWTVAGLRSRILDLMSSMHADAFMDWKTTPIDKLLATWESYFVSPSFRSLITRQVADSPEAIEVLRLLRKIDANHPVFLQRKSLLLERLPLFSRGQNSPSCREPVPGCEASSCVNEREDPFADLIAIREAAQVQGAGKKSAWSDPGEYERYRDACKKLREKIDQILPKPFDWDAARPFAQASLDLHRLAIEAAARYTGEKTRLARLDFDDLVAKAVQLLTDPDHATIRQQLVGGNRAILVDEFQDTDAQQAKLINAICGDHWKDGHLFFVGDIKQSIYRFRGAQPGVFRALRSNLPDRGVLALTHCFRTQPAVLDFINALFIGAWGDDYERLEPVRPQQTPQPAVEFLWTKNDPPENQRGTYGQNRSHSEKAFTIDPIASGSARASETNIPVADLRAAEARAIAARLVELLDHRTPLIPESKLPADSAVTALRPLRLGDIAILFRALTDIQVYEVALQEAGLDYYLVGGHAFYAQQEIYDLANVLRAVASSADEIALAGALRSSFFSLADESLFWLVREGGSLNGGLLSKKAMTALPESEREKVARAACILSWLRSVKDHAPIARLVDMAVSATGYDATLLAEFLGERKLANLRKLQHHARLADRDGLLGLHGFISQLGELITRMPKEPPASTSALTADVICLMTIHQAKGLEFPCVVVADLDRPSQGRRANVRYSPELGPLIRPSKQGPLSLAETSPGAESPSSTGFEIHQAIDAIEEQEESMRLFYVACTRAADRLILSSSVKAFDNPRGEWMRLLARRFDLETGRMLVDLPPGYNAPRVQVMQRLLDGPVDPRKRRHRTSLRKVLEAAHAAAANASPLPTEIAPIPPDRAVERRFSFSRLSGALIQQNEDADAVESQPRSGHATQRVDPRRLGSLVHAILERLDPGDSSDIGTLVARLAPQFFDQPAMGPDHPAIVTAISIIRRFLATPRSSSLAAARQIFREVEFHLAWPPKQMSRLSIQSDPANPSPALEGFREQSGKEGPPPIFGRASGPYVHGYIDCLYEDLAGRWILLDYKTNQLRSDHVAEVASQYEMQLSVYTMAVGEILGRPPDEVAVHFLRTGQEHTFCWDTASIRAMVEQVNRAIMQLVTRGGR
ncbi:MAG: UvrD-helicase domain-containing protein [Pirellulales bacterium]|nr:UvrD-helicase domain-containing protein [Pirellulales bacterium]